MEPLLRAWSCFRRRKFRQCAELCSQLLEAAPGEQVAGPGRAGRPGWGRRRAGPGWGFLGGCPSLCPRVLLERPAASPH